MSYEEYTAIAAGETVPKEDFDFYAKKAEKLLSLYTYGRSENSDDEAVKYAQAELILRLYDAQRRRGIVSEANDGLSIRFDEDEDCEGELRSVIKLWLGESGMMYPGVETDDN